MNKQIVEQIEVLISDLLQDPSNSEKVLVVKAAIKDLEASLTSYMETLASGKGHLSETQKSLVELVCEEFQLMHLPKLKNLYNIVDRLERHLIQDSVIIH
jgi:hypothetical protein